MKRTKIVVTRNVKVPRRMKDRVEMRIEPIRSRLRTKSIVADKENVFSGEGRPIKFRRAKTPPGFLQKVEESLIEKTEKSLREFQLSRIKAAVLARQKVLD